MRELQKIRTDELRLGDVVGPPYSDIHDAWSCCIVKRIRDGRVTLFRPYGITPSWTNSGEVSCWMGSEEFSMPADETLVHLFHRGLLDEEVRCA